MADLVQMLASLSGVVLVDDPPARRSLRKAEPLALHPPAAPREPVASPPKAIPVAPAAAAVPVSRSAAPLPPPALKDALPLPAPLPAPPQPPAPVPAARAVVPAKLQLPAMPHAATVTPRRGRINYLYKPETPLVWLSKRDGFNVVHAMNNVHVFGSIGSGKTSGSGRSLAKSYLRANWGGLVLCATPEDRRLWESMARETNRSASVIVIGPDQPWRFNFLAYDLHRSRGLAQRIENVMSTLQDVLAQAGKDKGGGDSRQWIDAAIELFKSGLAIVAAARDHFTYGEVIDFIAEAPTTLDGFKAEGFTETSFARLLAEAEERNATHWQWEDFGRFVTYWRRDYPRLVEGPRESSRFVLNHLFASLQTGTVRELFGTRCNVLPEDTFAGAIIILDLPTAVSNTNVFAAMLFKLIWQRAVLRRTPHPELRPTFLWADESHMVTSPFDSTFASLSRKHASSMVYLTQNISGYYQRMPAPAQDTTRTMLGNFGTQIFHAQADTETIEHARKLFGQHVVRRRSEQIGSSASESSNWGQSDKSHGPADHAGRNAGEGRERGRSESESYQEQLEDVVTAEKLSKLKTGGSHHGLRVSGYVYQTGRVWKRTGTNCLYCEFPQTI